MLSTQRCEVNHLLHGNAFTAAAMLASTIARAKLPVAVPEATGSALAQMRSRAFAGKSRQLLRKKSHSRCQRPDEWAAVRDLDPILSR
jgi:hypothetical protein